MREFFRSSLEIREILMSVAKTNKWMKSITAGGKKKITFWGFISKGAQLIETTEPHEECGHWDQNCRCQKEKTNDEFQSDESKHMT